MRLRRRVKKRITAAAMVAALALLPFSRAQMLLSEADPPAPLAQNSNQTHPCSTIGEECEPLRDIVFALDETAPASHSLLTQVLTQGAFGQLECDPVLTLECRSPFECLTIIIYDASETYLADQMYYARQEFWERRPASECEYRITGVSEGDSLPFLFAPRGQKGRALAANGAVPEPASWIAMILGLFAIGGAARLRNAARGRAVCADTLVDTLGRA